MKKITTILFALALFGFSACDKETTKGLSSVTNYPLFEVSGNSTVFLPVGTDFTEPGIKATEDGEEISVKTSFNGIYRGGSTFDKNAPDCYDVTYTATNVDGYDGTSKRDVYVVETGDLKNSISGLYTSTIVRNGALRFSDLEYVLVWQNTDGTYEFSCGFGAYYQIGTGYGLGYRSSGCVVTANDIAANDFSITDFSNDGFGGAITDAKLTVDAANKKMILTSEWSFGFSWEVELTQVEI